MLEVLIQHGLRDRFPEECRRWMSMKENLDKELRERRSASLREAMKRLESDGIEMNNTLLVEILRRLKVTFP